MAVRTTSERGSGFRNEFHMRAWAKWILATLALVVVLTFVSSWVEQNGRESSQRIDCIDSATSIAQVDACGVR